MENTNGSRHEKSREKSKPAMVVWNQGKPVEALISSIIHEDKLARDQTASPSAARSPDLRGVRKLKSLKSVTVTVRALHIDPENVVSRQCACTYLFPSNSDTLSR